MSELPVIATLHATISVNGREEAVQLVSVALPSLAGVDDVLAAGMQMFAAQIDAGELSISAIVDDEEAVTGCSCGEADLGAPGHDEH